MTKNTHSRGYVRATVMAEAFINAAVKQTRKEKVDHKTGQGSWIARRVMLNYERGSFATVKE